MDAELYGKRMVSFVADCTDYNDAMRRSLGKRFASSRNNYSAITRQITRAKSLPNVNSDVAARDYDSDALSEASTTPKYLVKSPKNGKSANRDASYEVNDWAEYPDATSPSNTYYFADDYKADSNGVYDHGSLSHMNNRYVARSNESSVNSRQQTATIGRSAEMAVAVEKCSNADSRLFPSSAIPSLPVVDIVNTVNTKNTIKSSGFGRKAELIRSGNASGGNSPVTSHHIYSDIGVSPLTRSVNAPSYTDSVTVHSARTDAKIESPLKVNQNDHSKSIGNLKEGRRSFARAVNYTTSNSTNVDNSKQGRFLSTENKSKAEAKDVGQLSASTSRQSRMQQKPVAIQNPISYNTHGHIQQFDCSNRASPLQIPAIAVSNNMSSPSLHHIILDSPNKNAVSTNAQSPLHRPYLGERDHVITRLNSPNSNNGFSDNEIPDYLDSPSKYENVNLHSGDTGNPFTRPRFEML